MAHRDAFKYDLGEVFQTDDDIWTVEKRVLDVDASMAEVPREYVLASDEELCVVNEEVLDSEDEPASLLA